MATTIYLKSTQNLFSGLVSMYQENRFTVVRIGRIGIHCDVK